MLKLPIQEINPLTVFQKCLEDFDNQNIKNMLESLEDDIDTYTTEYINKASNETIYEIEQRHIFNGDNLKDSLKRLYEDYMVKNSSKGRIYYDQIKSNYFTCSVCNHQVPSTLDHFLPKSKFPIYAVNPKNLVPCCNDCNTAKSTFSASNYGEQLIHPYFDLDVFFNKQWLKAEILEMEPIGVVFTTLTLEEWDDDSSYLNRISNHFIKYKLNKMYTPQAISEINSMKMILKNKFREEGTLSVEMYLRDIANSKKEFHPNSWQAATYKALSESEWFCNIWVS